MLAAGVRLIDLGFFRAGNEEYAAENGTYGLATVLREHVTCRNGAVTFAYPVKGAKERHQAVAEASVCKVVTGLKRRKDDGPGLLAYRDGRDWYDVNDYLGEVSGGAYTAKDFRAWHATVLTAVGLAVSVRAGTSAAARGGQSRRRGGWLPRE